MILVEFCYSRCWSQLMFILLLSTIIGIAPVNTRARELVTRPTDCVEGSNGSISYHGQLAYSFDGHVRVIDLESGFVQEFDGGRVMVAPEWYPAGRLIAFGEGNLGIVDTVTGEVSIVADFESALTDPSWSPDGKQIAFVGLEKVANRGVYIADVQKSAFQKLNFEARNAVHTAWSPTGEQIAFADRDAHGTYQIFSVDVRSCLVENECVVTQLTDDSRGLSFEPAWSPDGNQITFTSKREGQYAIYVMNADGSSQHQIMSGIEENLNPTWSPDGQHIAFERWYRIDEPVEGTIDEQILIMRPDGSEATCVTATGGTEPDWWMPSEMLESDKAPEMDSAK